MAEYGAAALNLDITKDLASFLADLSFDQLSDDAVRAGRRGVLDWLGCALAGSDRPTINTLVGVLTTVGGAPQATVIGRGLKLGLLEAPLANGQMGHVLDYDDTHRGGLHPSSPMLSALFALAEQRTVSGAELITAYAAGFEAGVRAGLAAPGHHPGGWHLTGTLGSIAAGAAAGKLLGLDAKCLTHALGIAATQAGGMQQNRGTMCKSFHAGKAAANGVLAALLAEQGFDSSDEILEGKRGFCRIYSDRAEPERVLDQLGERWEILGNGHKPYACGVVLHPAIDAMIEQAKTSGFKLADVAAIELAVHPLAVTITGVVEPKTGLQSKFSLYHSAAVAFIDQTAGIAQYSDERAASPEVTALRQKVSVTVDEDLERDQARAAVTATDGRRHETSIEHATGTVGNPLSDAAIEEKFLANAEPVLGAERAGAVRDLAWQADSLDDAKALIEACA